VLADVCRDILALNGAAMQRKHERSRPESMEPRVCSECEEEKLATAFAWDNISGMIRKRRCRECDALAQRARRAAAKRRVA
jgi:hypothetical protein